MHARREIRTVKSQFLCETMRQHIQHSSNRLALTHKVTTLIQLTTSTGVASYCFGHVYQALPVLIIRIL